MASTPGWLDETKRSSASAISRRRIRIEGGLSYEPLPAHVDALQLFRGAGGGIDRRQTVLGDTGIGIPGLCFGLALSLV